ncbi:nucleoside monophosphate kinase [Candidatus Saccharibacteria bacterium]|nr:nucleoside monophosphate kinase [Candidatus Saccharibacteria bacterium]MCB9821296.1 nucleoside monophosphate kinase [Candidatus Nomurabacteria bacterium]
MFIISGPPGAGKTTQARLLSERSDFIWISAGNLLRNQAKGEELAEMLDGELVDDDYVDKLVSTELDKYQEDHSRVMLDGFPRDFYEARWLVETYGADVVGYIIIQVDEAEIRRRMQLRGRQDDNAEAIEERIKIFHKQTEHVAEYFAEQLTPIYIVDGNSDVESVYSQIKQIVEENGQN